MAQQFAGMVWRDRMLAGLGALAGIIAVMAVGHGLAPQLDLWLGGTFPPIIAPIGASAVLVFAVPASPLAQPWPVVGGNLLSALVGAAVAMVMPDPLLAAGLAVGLAIVVMSLAGCLHPPGGGTALLATVGGKGAAAASLLFGPGIVLANALVLVAAGWLWHRWSGHSYPHRPAVVATATPMPPAIEALLHRDDIDKALADMGESFDISIEDLDMLLHRAEAHAAERGAVLATGR